MKKTAPSTAPKTPESEDQTSVWIRCRGDDAQTLYRALKRSEEELGSPGYLNLTFRVVVLCLIGGLTGSWVMLIAALAFAWEGWWALRKNAETRLLAYTTLVLLKACREGWPILQARSLKH